MAPKMSSPAQLTMSQFNPGLAHLNVPHAGVHGLRVSHEQEGREDQLSTASGAGAHSALSVVGDTETLAVVSTAQRSDVSVVDSREERNGSGGADVLVGVLVNQSLDLLVGPQGLVQENVVVDRTSGTLDGSVGAQVEVVLIRLGDAGLDKSARQSVVVLVAAALGEEAHMVALGSDDDQEFGSDIAFGEGLLHGSHFLVDDLSELALGNTVAEVDYSGRRLALADLGHPAESDERHDVLLDILVGDHLDAVAVGLDSGSVTSALDVH